MSTLTYWVASLGNPKRKTLLAFLIQQNDLLGVLAGVEFLLKRKGCFSFGVLPLQVFGQCAGKYSAQTARAGVWGGIRAGFTFLFGGQLKNTHKIIKSFYDQSADLSFPKNVGIF